jgi:hypothetical protein
MNRPRECALYDMSSPRRLCMREHICVNSSGRRDVAASESEMMVLGNSME